MGLVSVRAIGIVLLTLPSLAMAQYDCIGQFGIPVSDASVSGVVTEVGSNRKLPAVFISINKAPFGHTDCQGRFELPRFQPGRYWISTGSPYFFPESTQVEIERDKVSKVTFSLRLQPPSPDPVDSLVGSWTLSLYSRSDTSRQLLGTGSLKISPGRWTRLGTEAQADIDLDYKLLWGKATRSPFTDSYRRVSVHTAGDTVDVWLTPGMFDAGFSLKGFVRADSVTGYWCSHNFAHTCEVRGDFILSRP